jgi:hypothetical protein
MELFEASVKIVRPELRRVEGLENKPSERARRDFKSLAKVSQKLEELLETVLVTKPDCDPPRPDCKNYLKKKTLEVITTVLENSDYNVSERLEYLDELIKSPELITPLLKEPVGD